MLHVFAAVKHPLILRTLHNHAGQATLHRWYAAACSQKHHTNTHLSLHLFEYCDFPCQGRVDVGEVGFHMPISPALCLIADMFNVLGEAIQIRCPTPKSSREAARDFYYELFGGGF